VEDDEVVVGGAGLEWLARLRRAQKAIGAARVAAVVVVAAGGAREVLRRPRRQGVAVGLNVGRRDDVAASGGEEGAPGRRVFRAVLDGDGADIGAAAEIVLAAAFVEYVRLGPGGGEVARVDDPAPATAALGLERDDARVVGSVTYRVRGAVAGNAKGRLGRAGAHGGLATAELVSAVVGLGRAS